MADLMHHGGRHVSFRTRLRSVLRIHNALGERQDDVVYARIHIVLEEDFLGSLLFVNPRIIGQIVGHSLIAVAQITSPKWCIHHLHRRGLACF